MKKYLLTKSKYSHKNEVNAKILALIWHLLWSRLYVNYRTNRCLLFYYFMVDGCEILNPLITAATSANPPPTNKQTDVLLL